MTEKVDCLVVGGGVVGLAVARRLALAGREVVVVEAESRVGSHTSSRNSGVIHAGLNAPNTLKGRLCIRGRQMLYAYCAERDVGHSRIGKLIIAPAAAGAEGLARLQQARAQAEANGVDDLQTLTANEAYALEPELDVSGALLSPSSGIIDTHELMSAYCDDIRRYGGAVVCKSPALSGRVRSDGVEIALGGAEEVTVHCNTIINSAGLNAQRLAGSIEGMPKSLIPGQRLAKGSYFVLSGQSPFRHLIYPIHTSNFRSMHTTLDLAGQLRFGPDVEWVETIDYRIDELRDRDFYTSIRRFWPGLPDGALMPGWAGVRPKLALSPTSSEGDFIIQCPKDHGVPGLINLFGIESPGLTASLAIAEEVFARLASAA